MVKNYRNEQIFEIWRIRYRMMMLFSLYFSYFLKKGVGSVKLGHGKCDGILAYYLQD